MSDKRSPKNIFVFNIIYFFPLCVLYSIQIYAFSQTFLVSSIFYLIGLQFKKTDKITIYWIDASHAAGTADTHTT